MRAALVTPEYFEVLGASALCGRALTKEDGREASGTPPVVLTHGFWRRRFGAQPWTTGQKLRERFAHVLAASIAFLWLGGRFRSKSVAAGRQ